MHLRNTATPMGVAEFRYIETLPEGFKGNLPTVEDLEAELGPSKKAVRNKGDPTWSASRAVAVADRCPRAINGIQSGFVHQTEIADGGSPKWSKSKRPILSGYWREIQTSIKPARITPSAMTIQTSRFTWWDLSQLEVELCFCLSIIVPIAQMGAY